MLQKSPVPSKERERIWDEVNIFHRLKKFGKSQYSHDAYVFNVAEVLEQCGPVEFYL